MMFRLAASCLTTLCLLLSATTGPALAAGSVVEAPAGNRNAEQPPVPGASARRTAALQRSYEGKYRKVRDLIGGDGELRRKIVRAAKKVQIDPIHIVGAIVGEHTYNVDAYDRLQSYYVKAAAYLNNEFGFSHGGESVTSFIARPPFERCEDEADSYDLWTCREGVWESDFRGRTVDEQSFPDNRFSAVFFQPFYAGQTFGLGQLNPLTALMLSDDVHRLFGYGGIAESDPQHLYEAIMDPDQSIAFIAAAIARSIDAYETIAGVDISGNPGLTATLYNLGGAERRAAELARKSAGGNRVWPQENYYGWLVNEKLDDLCTLFDSGESAICATL